MVSLAGVPPLAGFFGKFLLLKSVAEQAVNLSAYYWLIGVAVIGVVMSFYYYFSVIRAIFWSKDPADVSPIAVPVPTRLAIYVCVAGMLYLGMFPDCANKAAEKSAGSLVAFFHEDGTKTTTTTALVK
jgi:NADH-quinone oxidoreductase subunit N